MDRKNTEGYTRPLTMTRRSFLRATAGLAIVALLPACRRSAPSSTPLSVSPVSVDTAAFKKPGPWRLGRSGRGDTTSWMVMFSAHIEYGAKAKYHEHFKDYFSTSGNWDPNKQIEDIQILLREGIDLLLIDPMDTAVVSSGVERAMAAGVPVILASTKVQSERFVSWVTTAEEARGAACADWLLQRGTGQHIVVLESSPASADSTLWVQGVRQRLDAEPDLPGGRRVQYLRSAWLSSEAERLTSDLLAASPDVDGFIVNNGVLGRGVVQAFVKQGRPIPPIAGGDDWNGWLRTAQENDVRFLGLSGGANLGLQCVELAMRVLAGEPVPGYVEFPYETFDDSTLGRYFRPDLSDSYWAVNDLPEAWIERMFVL